MKETRHRTLIADDELLARKRLSRLLSAMPEFELISECETGEQALDFINKNEVDIALLDIKMPGLTGLDVKALIDQDLPIVIFTTAHPEHALKAFDLGALDYVLKPVEPTRLRKALDRAIERLPKSTETRRIALTSHGEVRLIDPRQISHATIDGALVTVSVKGETIFTDLSLRELEKRLPTDLFERVHRRSLLNLDHVERLQPLETGGYTAVTKSGEKVPISRQVARRLRQKFGL